MLRHLFRCAVRLHPASFRRRFGEEMLCIFDQQRGTPAAITVTLDCFLSLLRQWMLRPNGGAELPAPPLRTPAADHIPLFESLDPFQPRTSAIIHGALLSLILFYMTVISIPYSWIHILNPRFPEAGVTSRQRTGAQTRLPVDVIPAEPGGLSSKASASGIPGTDASAPKVRIWLDSYVGTYISNHPPAQISIQIEGDPGASESPLCFAGGLRTLGLRALACVAYELCYRGSSEYLRRFHCRRSGQDLLLVLGCERPCHQGPASVAGV
jgi:hypothetical protein